MKLAPTDPEEERRYVHARIDELNRRKEEDRSLWLRDPSRLARIDAELKSLHERRCDLLQGRLL